MISIEQSILKGLLFSESYSSRVMPYLDNECFDGAHRTAFNVYKTLYDKYGTRPNLDAIGVSLQKEKLGEAEFSDILEVFDEAFETKDDLPDFEWLVDETESYVRDKKVYNAIYNSIGIIEGDDSKFDKNAIPSLLQEALNVSFNETLGMDFYDDAEARYNFYTSEEELIKVPTDALTTLMNGGLRKKTLSALLGFTNTGKSALMAFMAGEMMKMGYNVLYITLEMAEELVHQRVDANLLDIRMDDFKDMKKEDFMSKIQKVKSKTAGKLYVKEYPTSSAHTGHFRHFIRELKQKRNFSPDVVFVDYINIMASSRYKSLSGVNSYSYIKAIAEELRGLAVELQTPFFTATQTNRDNANSGSPDMTATSESIGLPMSLDWFAAITADEVLQENNQILLHLLKTRWGGKSQVKPKLLKVLWEKMRYTDVGSTADVASNVGQKPDFKSKREEKKTPHKKNTIDFGDD